jgi:two-component system NtrC family sensor kinase
MPAAITARRIVYEGVRATVGAIVDLTERKRIEAELARQREALYQSEKLSALGSLLAGMAHEINNPLSVVVGRAILLEEDAPDAATAAAVVKIRQAAERCTRIVKTFLAMARQQPPERVPVHLNELISAALELVSYGLRTAGITVRLDLASDLPTLLADAAQLQQVFSNLFVNAQQALLEVPEPRWLHVTTCWERQSHVVCITVTDNGPGVPAPIHSRIFDPFFTTKPLGVGTGVGLSLSHAIITAHGGSLIFDLPWWRCPFCHHTASAHHRHTSRHRDASRSSACQTAYYSGD